MKILDIILIKTAFDLIESPKEKLSIHLTKMNGIGPQNGEVVQVIQELELTITELESGKKIATLKLKYALSLFIDGEKPENEVIGDFIMDSLKSLHYRDINDILYRAKLLPITYKDIL